MPVNLRRRWMTPMLRANSWASCANTCRNTLAMRGTVIMVCLLLRTSRDGKCFLYLLTGAHFLSPLALPSFSFSFLPLNLTPIGRSLAVALRCVIYRRNNYCFTYNLPGCTALAAKRFSRMMRREHLE